MALGKRLEHARKLRGYTQEHVATAAGLEPGSGRATIQILEARDSSRTKYASQIARALGVSLTWLLTGEGPMEEGPRHELTLRGGMTPWDDNTPPDSDDINVPLYKEIEFAGGDGSSGGVELSGRQLKFARSTLRAANVDEANAACATVNGNSMEPRIGDGATVGIDRGDTRIRDGKIYAFRHNDQLRVKYLYRLPSGGLRIHSENHTEHPDETYSPQEVSEQIEVLGRVFWVSQMMF